MKYIIGHHTHQNLGHGGSMVNTFFLYDESELTFKNCFLNRKNLVHVEYIRKFGTPVRNSGTYSNKSKYIFRVELEDIERYFSQVIPKQVCELSKEAQEYIEKNFPEFLV